ncbi:MAG: TatD family hydrolase [Bacteroidetes bacterium]|nr:TatD family hydrolase [Bacteroidota bacterium]
MQWINIHTHQPPQAQEFAIQSRYKNFETMPAAGLFSAGIHPWYIDADWPQQLQVLQHYAAAPNVLAIGECGLDALSTTDFALQQQVFAQQVLLANQLQKPLILHCVKAYDRVVQLLQQSRVRVPVIFHGFNRNAVLAGQLVAKDYYVSFGKALERIAVQEALRAVPVSKIFLETDDAPVPIAAIYEYAATALQIDSNTLYLQLKKNTLAVFGNSITGL